MLYSHYTKSLNYNYLQKLPYHPITSPFNVACIWVRIIQPITLSLS